MASETASGARNTLLLGKIIAVQATTQSGDATFGIPTRSQIERVIMSFEPDIADDWVGDIVTPQGRMVGALDTSKVGGFASIGANQAVVFEVDRDDPLNHFEAGDSVVIETMDPTTGGAAHITIVLGP